MKRFFYFLVFIILLVSLFAKPLSIYFLEKSLTRSLKRDVTIHALEFFPLNLDASIKMQYYPQGIDVHASYEGGLSLSPKSIGKFLITSSSLGGKITVEYEHYIYNIDIKSVDFKKLATALNDRKQVVQAGLVNGKIVYYKKKKEGSTDLKVTKVRLKVPDIDKTIVSVNDAINLNVMSLFSHNVFTKQAKGTLTQVDHIQFDILYKNKDITVKDVALRTDNYRISLVSKLDKKGNIDYFFIHLLDKNGCAIVTQELQYNIKKPSRKTSTQVQNVVQASPNSFFNMGKQMMQYSSDYAGKQTGMQKQTKQMTSYMINGSDKIFNNTSTMVLNTQCKVIYDGKVKHPQKTKSSKEPVIMKTPQVNPLPQKEIDVESSSTLYRKKLLL